MTQSVSETGSGKITTSTPSTQSWWSQISSSRDLEYSWPTTGWSVTKLHCFKLPVMKFNLLSAPWPEPILRIHHGAHIRLHEVEERPGRVEDLSYHQLAGDPPQVPTGGCWPLCLPSQHPWGLCRPLQCIIVLILTNSSNTQHFTLWKFSTKITVIYDASLWLHIFLSSHVRVWHIFDVVLESLQQIAVK